MARKVCSHSLEFYANKFYWILNCCNDPCSPNIVDMLGLDLLC